MSGSAAKSERGGRPRSRHGARRGPSAEWRNHALECPPSARARDSGSRRTRCEDSGGALPEIVVMALSRWRMTGEANRATVNRIHPLPGGHSCTGNYKGLQATSVLTYIGGI